MAGKLADPLQTQKLTRTRTLFLLLVVNPPRLPEKHSTTTGLVSSEIRWGIHAQSNRSLSPLFCFAVSPGGSQRHRAPSISQPSMPDKECRACAHDMSNMKDMPMAGDKEDSGRGAHVMHSMEGHMDMGPHMKMTALRQPKPGDSARAQQSCGSSAQGLRKI